MVRLDGFLFLKYEIIMRINTKFKLRDIAGETIIVNQGTPEADLTRIISLNTSARLLWNELSDKDFFDRRCCGNINGALFCFGRNGKEGCNGLGRCLEEMRYHIG